MKNYTEEEFEEYFENRTEYFNKTQMICPAIIMILWIPIMIIIAYNLEIPITDEFTKLWFVGLNFGVMFLMGISIIFPGYWISQKLWKRKEKKLEI